MANETYGFLIPPWFHAEAPSKALLRVTNIIWGFTLAISVSAGLKAFNQSWNSYKRGKLYNAYIIMIWAEWIVCNVLSVLSWMLQDPGDSGLGPGFWVFLTILILWVVQLQCILQIIINRVRLLTDEHKAQYLKWGAAILVGLINISVFIIWIPAQLQISPEWIKINYYWDRTEKTLFALMDISLNVYFVYLVRSRLITNGLTKYQTLFRFNLILIFINLSLDIVLIGAMSVPNSAIYFQFHPLVYLIKLYLEMEVSDFIVKIVKAKNQLNEYNPQTVDAHVSSGPSTTESVVSTLKPQKSVV